MDIKFQENTTVLVEGKLCVGQRRRLERVKDLLEEMELLIKENLVNQEEILYEIDALCVISKNAYIMYSNIAQMSVGGYIVYNGNKFEKVSEHLYRVIAV